jgi:hypothetical protein
VAGVVESEFQSFLVPGCLEGGKKGPFTRTIGLRAVEGGERGASWKAVGTLEDRGNEGL